MAILVKVLDDVIARYAGAQYEAEAVAARGVYLGATGRVDDEDPLFEQRIAAFLEWYTLERKMDGEPARPIDLYRRDVPLGEREAQAAQALAASHWSLFQTVEVKEGRCMLDDLLGGGRFLVHERRTLVALEPGDVFEARLLSDQGKTLFGRTFCFHPRDAGAAIRLFVAQAVAQNLPKEEILFRLAEKRLRCERYHNVQVARIYKYDGAA